MRLRQEKVLQSVYNHVEGLPCRGVWESAHKQIKTATWDPEEAVHVGQAMVERAVCEGGQRTGGRDTR